MEDIPTQVLNNLSRLVWAILKSFKNDLLFPSKPPTLEEKLLSRINRQGAMIQSQQDRMIYQAGVLQDHDRILAERNDRIATQNRKIQNLAATIQSLEIELQVQASRNRRWR